MGFAVTTSQGAKTTSISQYHSEEPNQSLQLENTRRISKKLAESGKNYQNIRISFPISANSFYFSRVFRDCYNKHG